MRRQFETTNRKCLRELELRREHGNKGTYFGTVLDMRSAVGRVCHAIGPTRSDPNAVASD